MKMSNKKISIIKISTGYNHSLVLTNDGHLYAFGQNNHGQIIIPESCQGKVNDISAGM